MPNYQPLRDCLVLFVPLLEYVSIGKLPSEYQQAFQKHSLWGSLHYFPTNNQDTRDPGHKIVLRIPHTRFEFSFVEDRTTTSGVIYPTLKVTILPVKLLSLKEHHPDLVAHFFKEHWQRRITL